MFTDNDYWKKPSPNAEITKVLAFVLTSISTVIVALRFYSRHVLVGKLASSDWAMFLALIATWGSVVVTWYAIHFLDYREVGNIENDPIEEEKYAKIATASLFSFWMYRVSYILDLCLIKTSILLFYSHVASSNRHFRYVVYGLLFIVIVGSASMIIACIFSCYPIADAWKYSVFKDGLKGINATQCYNPGSFWLFNAAYNLITDVIIWTLPLIFFLNLRTMPLRRRLELIAIFSVGTMAIVASLIRLRTLVLWLSTPFNQSENQANILLWSQVEQHTGIIAACVPFLRPIFRKALVRIRSREQHSPGPAAPFVDAGTPGFNPGVYRTPIIPSPSPTIGSTCNEFKPPGCPLTPIQTVASKSDWETTIWDGTQAQPVPHT